MEPPARTIAHYAILAELGRGTTGIVYEARDTILDRRVALKIPLLGQGAERLAKTQRFLRECQVLAGLTGDPASRIPALHEVGEDGGQPYSIRELVDGHTLAQRVADRTIDLPGALAAFAEVARVVAWVNDRGLAHRNLSLENVLVANDDTAQLIGFGRVGLLTGSPALPPGATGASPEVDVQALQGLLGELFGAFGESCPSQLERLLQPGSVGSARELADAVAAFLVDSG
jgi:serine/threonine protein kinase